MEVEDIHGGTSVSPSVSDMLETQSNETFSPLVCTLESRVVSLDISCNDPSYWWIECTSIFLLQIQKMIWGQISLPKSCADLLFICFFLTPVDCVTIFNPSLSHSSIYFSFTSRWWEFFVSHKVSIAIIALNHGCGRCSVDSFLGWMFWVMSRATSWLPFWRIDFVFHLGVSWKWEPECHGAAATIMQNTTSDCEAKTRMMGHIPDAMKLFETRSDQESLASRCLGSSVVLFLGIWI